MSTNPPNKTNRASGPLTRKDVEDRLSHISGTEKLNLSDEVN
jgi:hypothetical protein